MLNWLSQKQIWLYRKPIDFRNQLDGLMMMVATEMKRQPNDGGIYLFRNKMMDKLKLLIWDRNGFWMGYKRLEKGRFIFPDEQSGEVQLSIEQLYLLISGLPMQALEIIPETQIQHFS